MGKGGAVEKKERCAKKECENEDDMSRRERRSGYAIHKKKVVKIGCFKRRASVVITGSKSSWTR